MTFVKTWTVIPPARATDTDPWTTIRIREAEASTGPWTVIDTQAWADSTPSSPDPVEIETSNATIEVAWYQFEWEDGTGAVSRSAPVYDIGSTAFATATDLLARLGETEFTDGAEAAQAAVFLNNATANIAAAVGKTDEWAAALSPVPAALKALCVELAARAMVNPTGVRSQSEQLGSWQRSESYTDDAHLIDLSPSETLRARAIVYGSNSGSAQATSTMDDIAETVLSPPLP